MDLDLARLLAWRWEHLAAAVERAVIVDFGMQVVAALQQLEAAVAEAEVVIQPLGLVGLEEFVAVPAWSEYTVQEQELVLAASSAVVDTLVVG